MNKILRSFFLISICLFSLATNATIRYVKTGNGGTAPYISWATASNDLQAVINACIAGDEIWVATGQYKPNRRADAPTVITAADRNDAFVLKNGVKIYGGFLGIGSETLLSQRDYVANVVELSGDLGLPGAVGDNCYHVIVSASNTNTAVLNGFTIAFGFSNISTTITVGTRAVTGSQGGGIYVVASSPTITNCKFDRNNTTKNGGAIFDTLSSNPVISSCTFIQNGASNNGGAIYNISSSPNVSNCTFTNNDAGNDGGGIYNKSSLPIIASCTFSYNNADNNGGAIYNNASSCKISGGSVANNTAANDGGGIYNSASSIDFSNATMTSNSAVNDGGAIFNSINSNSNISSLKITTNSAGNSGGAFYNVSCSPIISNCAFTRNNADYGGAIRNANADNTIIDDCEFKANTSVFAGGAFYDVSSAATVIKKCLFAGNTSGTTGGAMYFTSCVPTIINCLIAGNKSSQGAGVYSANSDPDFRNCTIAGNQASTYGGGVYSLITSSLTMYNSVVWGNDALTTGDNLYTLTTTFTIAQSDVQGGVTGTGNINIDPLFVSAIAASSAPSVSGNYRLQKCSPALNAGDNSKVPFGITTELAANPRINLSYVDMGAYEMTVSIFNVIPDAAGIVYVDITNAGDGSTWISATAELADALAAAKFNSAITQVWVAKGTYFPKYNRFFKSLVCSTTDMFNSFVLPNNIKLYGGFVGVETDTSGRNFITNETILSGDIGTTGINTDNCGHILVCISNSGTQEVNGFTVTKGEAIGGAGIIGAGMYIVNASVDLENCIFSANNCNEKGGGVYAEDAVLSVMKCSFSNNKIYSTFLNLGGAAITGNNSSVQINYCIFSANNSVANAGAIMGENNSNLNIAYSNFDNNTASIQGGAVFNSTTSILTLSHCNFVGNNSQNGGAVHIETGSSALSSLKDCSFMGNGSSNFGGALCCHLDIEVINCLFSGNKADQKGGALHFLNGTSYTVSNCTLSGNNAIISGSAIFSDDGTCNIRNSIIYGNATANSIFGGTYAIGYSLVQGGYAGTGNLNTDPLFINPQIPSLAPTSLGDYRLLKCSPAINSGSNALISSGIITDLDVEARIAISTVDLGAYEKQDVDLANTTWKGVNTNWNDKINWCGGYIPTDTTNVAVPSTSNNPAIGAGFSNEVKNISLANSTSLGVANTSSFTINGTYTNSGSTITNNGTWIMAGNAANQTFPGTLATVSAMNNLKINNSSGIKFDKAFEIKGTLTPTAGNINIDNATITLNSEATSTARVAAVPAAVALSYTGTGKFEVERYIPPHRAWRLLTAPLGTATNLTISQAWQEGVSNSNRLSPVDPSGGFGTSITKSSTYSAADGYDQGSTNNPSIRYYNGASWGGFPSKTIGTTPGANNGLITDQPGYMLFVRGDRSIVVAGTGVATTITTLRPKGQLKVGPQIIVCNGWTVIGNPYASPINFHKIVLDNTGLPDVFYVWDANLAGSFNVGGWVSYGSYKIGTQTYTVAPLLAASTFANNRGDVSSGSAFMVNYNGTITINESNKSTLGDIVLLRPVRQLSMNLYVANTDSNETLVDGLAILLDRNVSVTNAEKNKNFTENLAIAFDNKQYSIQNRIRPNFNDTIFISTGQMKQRNYVLEIKADELDMPHQMKAWLEDVYLPKYKPVALEGNTRYAFSVGADSNSASAARFRLLFKKAPHFIHINAIANEKDIEVQWAMDDIFGINQYQIERSDNGVDFITLISLSTNRNNEPLLQNSWLGISPVTGAYYYRIKAILADGETVYSDISKATMVKNAGGVYVYPNPVSGNSIQLRMNDLPAGKYSVKLLGMNGQVILTQQWNHKGGLVTKKIELPAGTANGTYQLHLIKPTGKQVVAPVEIIQ